MSHTIYGNTTKNGINIDDMIDDNNDVIYPINNTDTDDYKYFARLVMSRQNIEDEPLPAIAIFEKNNPFTAIYANILPGSFEQYYNEALPDKQLNKTIELFNCFIERINK